MSKSDILSGMNERINEADPVNLARAHLKEVTGAQAALDQLRLFCQRSNVPADRLKSWEEAVTKLINKPDGNPRLQLGLTLLEQQKQIRTDKDVRDVDPERVETGIVPLVHQRSRRAALVLPVISREDYMQKIRPHAEEARISHRILRTFWTLDQEKLASSGLDAAAGGKPPRSLEEIDKDNLLIGGDESRALHAGRFHDSCNAIIGVVNELKASRDVAEGIIEPETVLTRSRPQKKKPTRSIAVRQESSPGLPHNDLGDLAIYRPRKLPGGLKEQISKACQAQWPDNRGKEHEAFAVALTMPGNLTGDHQSIPRALADPEILAQGIAEIVQLLDQFRGGVLTLPTSTEIGKKSANQPFHIERYIKATLAACLEQELVGVGLSDTDLRKLYGRMGRTIRRAAKWADDFELVERVINELPDAMAAALTARFSNDLAYDLGLPAGWAMSERRLAELMNKTSFEGATCEETSTARILEVLEGRLRQHDINLQLLFGEIESLDYGKSVIAALFEAADDYGKEILLSALNEAPYFADLKRNLWREHYGSSQIERNLSGLVFEED